MNEQLKRQEKRRSCYLWYHRDDEVTYLLNYLSTEGTDETFKNLSSLKEIK